jgi:hypothetical protein
MCLGRRETAIQNLAVHPDMVPVIGIHDRGAVDAGGGP